MLLVHTATTRVILIMDEDYDRAYLSGRELWGDDFDPQQIAAWFEDEREAYSDLGAAEHGTADSYGYHALNVRHGFRYLPSGRLHHTLGIGSAYGGEFLPIIDRLDQLTILEPSANLRSTQLRGVPVRYVDPDPLGDMPFDDGVFDLVVTLGTLHHIPNVSHVVSEIGRVAVPGGHVLVREPITSMGDWRSPRPGLTRRERGIPRTILRNAFEAAGLELIRETSCMFPTTRRLDRWGFGFNSTSGVILDRALSTVTSWNRRYHATSPWHKVHPAASFFLLRRA